MPEMSKSSTSQKRYTMTKHERIRREVMLAISADPLGAARTTALDAVKKKQLELETNTNNVSNRLTQTGTNKAYSLRKLKKGAPKVFKKVMVG